MTGTHYPGLTADAVAARAAALARFARWEAAHPAAQRPADAVAAAGALYDLLPNDARVRAADPSGVVALHALLARAGRRPR